ncbi:MAG: ThuA domain-containing protein [Planctomycetota bacterium]
MGVLAAVAPTLAAAAETSERPQDAAIRAVIVTGVDWPGRPPNVPGHEWKKTAPALKDILETDPRFQVTIVEDPAFLASDELFAFDEINLHFKNLEPIPNEQKAKANLLRFVREGGGLVVIHYASGAFEGWTEFQNLVGRTQGKRHDKRAPFTVKMVDHEHPVTRGLEDFEADDELFIDLTGERPVQVLASATSNITGKEHPMAFVFSYEKGRVFHTTLGHDVTAIRGEGTSELIRRGATWAAGVSQGNER